MMNGYYCSECYEGFSISEFEENSGECPKCHGIIEFYEDGEVKE